MTSIGRPRAVQSCELAPDPSGVVVPHICCRKCAQSLPWTREHFFSRGYKHDPDYLNNLCKTCAKRDSSSWGKQHPEQMRECGRRSAAKHPEIAQRSSRKRTERYRSDEQYRQKTLTRNREREQADPARYAAYRAKQRRSPKFRATANRYRRRRYAEDPSFKLAFLMRERMRIALKKGGASKAKHTLEYAGCSIEFLRWWIESQFLPGMSWDNWGTSANEWHLDHIYPCSCFDLTKEEQLRVCFGWTNMRPLWSRDNLSKGDDMPSPNYDI